MHIKGDLRSPEIKNVLARTLDSLSWRPAVVLDITGKPLAWAHLASGPFFFRVRVPSDNAGYRHAVARAAAMRTASPARPVYRADGVLAGYLVTGRGDAETDLLLLSFLLAAVFMTIVFIMYFSFFSLRMNERSNLWVALAKETAHQLGTPITALLGWVEYLKSSRDGESTVEPAMFISQVETICGEMQNDLDRLRKISSRFSQIGSKPVLDSCDINGILRDSMSYFRVRLPLLRRRIEMRQTEGAIPNVNASRELLEWVFENLMKNSVDAMARDNGIIEVTTEYIEAEQIVRVIHRDDGKGITWEAHKKIFSPGYTTKTRGWGLGLTLAKRIIEDYHGGLIYVRWSRKDKGTVFCIDLPLHAKTV
jgi:signal transduction histidine kinase